MHSGRSRRVFSRKEKCKSDREPNQEYVIPTWTSPALTWMGSAMTTLQNRQSPYLDRSGRPELRSSVVPFPADAQDSICRDADGWWFLNYLESARERSQINGSFVEQHKESILKSLSVTTRHDVLPKFSWACRHHNVFCHWHRDASGYSDRYRIQRVDEQSTICRLSDAHHTTAG